MTSCTPADYFSINDDQDVTDDGTTPIVPNQPDSPADDDNPSTPSTPSEPSEPEEPIVPSEPNEPSEPSTPNEPDEPSEPDTPSEAVSITVEKSATQMAQSIDSDLNGTIMSGEVFRIDANVQVEFMKGSANTEPSFYNDAVRVYQAGGKVVITALNGKTLEKVVITYNDDKYGAGHLTVTGGSAPAKNGNTLTIIANEDSTAITITASGTNKNGRLYVESIQVTYLGVEGDQSTEDNQETPSTPIEPDNNIYLYNDFTSSEKSTYLSYIGFVIPFLPNDDYSIEAYDEDGYKGVYFSAACDSQTTFNNYLSKYSSYNNDGTDVDEYGDTWYLYSKNDVYLDVCFYNYEGTYYVDVDAYIETTTNDDNTSSGGNTGNGGSSSDTEYNVITNAGAGLPTDSDGVYDVDFTTATNVKNVTDQGYYLDGCPTVGSPAVLVIPVEFSDVTASSKGYTISKLKNAFVKDGVTDYYSVYDYYFKSSYGKLTLDVTVLDEWFRPSNNSSYYANATMDYEGTETPIGDQLIINEALAYLESKMDLSAFDSDGNNIIDSIVLINTLDIDDGDFYWAYRYWNTYTDDQDYYYEYDGVRANDYLWASYQFLFERYSGGSTNYDDTSVMNTYTFIHEFGHILGADDYYDTAYVGSPMGGYDIMDSETGDHNPYTKFNYGWLTSSRLVVTDTNVTLTLEDFSKNGDTIIIANNWDNTLGAYQEYYVLVYYTNNGLNAGEYGYFDEEGIVVYHVNASLYSEVYEGETYYDVYNTNTDPSDEYGTEDNLIELVESPNGDYVFEYGEALGTLTDDQGNTLKYTFTIESLDDESATITFNKR